MGIVVPLDYLRNTAFPCSIPDWPYWFSSHGVILSFMRRLLSQLPSPMQLSYILLVLVYLSYHDHKKTFVIFLQAQRQPKSNHRSALVIYWQRWLHGKWIIVDIDVVGGQIIRLIFIKFTKYSGGDEQVDGFCQVWTWAVNQDRKPETIKTKWGCHTQFHNRKSLYHRDDDGYIFRSPQHIDGIGKAGWIEQLVVRQGLHCQIEWFLGPVAPFQGIYLPRHGITVFFSWELTFLEKELMWIMLLRKP